MTKGWFQHVTLIPKQVRNDKGGQGEWILILKQVQIDNM
jgi:hypothetical protein